MTEAKTLRDVLASNMLDHPSATLPSMVEFGSNNEDDVQDVYAMVDRIIADDRLHVALSTPPADDVREAQGAPVAWAIYSSVTGQIKEVSTDRERVGDAIALGADVRPLFEVRPRGTFTDAKVHAAYEAFVAGPVDAHASMRAALEAAREVHP